MIALLAVVMVVASLGFAASMLEADDNSGISMNSDGIQTVSSEMDNNTGGAVPYTFGRDIRTINVGGFDVNVDLDARDSGFFDDILVTYKTLDKTKLQQFEIRVTFSHVDGESKDKIKTWTDNGDDYAKKILNSGIYMVDEITCEVTIKVNGSVGTYTVVFPWY